MNTELEQAVPKVAFLLGAGASVRAGVPDTYSFVKEFRESISDFHKRETLDKIINTLENWKGNKIDIELLLETLIKLDARESEPLLKFYEDIDASFTLAGYPEKEPIIIDVKNFIKEKAIIRAEDRIEYLYPLIGFIEEFGPLDIISFNYDTCIEMFCAINKLQYQDGFDVYWNPDNFRSKNADVRLYKMHGSVIWYRSDRGGYIKLPIMSGDSSVELITGERAETLMLYPMQKWDYSEPLLELLLETKRRLESKDYKLLIVAGYSFRDEYVCKMLWDVARKNRGLHIVIVDPVAHEIYHEKLKYYNRLLKTSSSLDERVICLPYKFDEVLSYLKDYYLKSLLQGLKVFEEKRQKELLGEKPKWYECISPLLNCEHVEAVERLLPLINTDEYDITMRLNVPFRLALNYAANERYEAEKYVADFVNSARHVFSEGLKIKTSSQRIDFLFEYHARGTKHTYLPVDLVNILEELHQYMEMYFKFITEENAHIIEVRHILNGLHGYLGGLGRGQLSYRDYVAMRKGDDSEMAEWDQMLKAGKGTSGGEGTWGYKIRKLEGRILDQIIRGEGVKDLK
jgi:hypothetical protein